VCDTDSHRNSKASKQQESVTGKPRITEDVIAEVAAEDSVQQCPFVELQALPSVQRQNDNETLTVVCTDATELVGPVSCSLNTKITPQTSVVKSEHSWHEVDENKNNCTTEHYCKTVFEDDLSVFFTSPISVPSLSVKLKTIPKRKATSKCKLEVTSDGHRALACNEHTAMNTVDCAESPQQFVLPLHDTATRNLDNPGVSVRVASYESSAVNQSSSVSQSLSISDTSQCGPLYPLGDASSDVHLSECLVSQSAISLPSSSSSLVVLSNNPASSCFTSKSSEYDQVKLDNNSSVPLLLEWTHTVKPLSTSSGMQVQSCTANSEQPLQRLGQNSLSKQRFLYPSAAPMSNVFEHIASSECLFPVKRRKSVLYRTPDILQSECTVAFSKAEEHMKKPVLSGSLSNNFSSGTKEITTLEDYGVNSKLILTSQLENGLQTASGVVICGLNTIAVTSVSAVCDIRDVNKDTVDDDSSMPTCTIIETDCYSNQQDIVTKSVSCSLPSSTNTVFCSKPVLDFAGQTSPRVSSQTTLCDVGVQASPEGLVTECTSCVRKQPLFVDAEVQTESVCLAHCTCCQLCKSRHDALNSPRRMNELWHGHCDIGSVSNLTMISDISCYSLVSNVDDLSVSNAYMNCFAATGGCTFQSASTFAGKTVDGHSGKSLLDGEGMKTFNTSNISVAAEHAEALSLDDPRELCAADSEAVSADRDLDSFNMLPGNSAQVVSDTFLKNTDSSLLKSFLTGFVSAGGKPLNVKLSSTLSAHKLFSDAVSAESDHSNNAMCSVDFSKPDFPASSASSLWKVGEYYDTTDTEPIQFTTSRLMDTGNDSKRFSGNEYTALAAATFDCVGMLQKSSANDLVSNGFKPFKAPRSVQSSKYRKNRLLTETEDQLTNSNKIESHSLKLEDKVNSLDETELLCDLTNTQRAEVLDASLAMLTSAELFATQCSDNIVDPAVEQMVTYNSAAVNALVSRASDEYVSDSSFSPNTNNVSKNSPVFVIPATNTEQTFENVLTGQVHHACDMTDPEAHHLNINTLQMCPVVNSVIHGEKSELGQICNVEENSELSSLTAADTTAELRDVEKSHDVPNVFMDAEFTDAEPDSVGVSSSRHEEIDIDQATSCAVCSCVNGRVSCRCAADLQKLAQSSELTNKQEMSEITHLLDGQLYRGARDKDESFSQNTSGMESDNIMEDNKDNPVTRSNPFVFFSAKGNKIKVSEKTLSSIRKSWSDHFTSAVSIAQNEATQLLDGQIYPDVGDKSCSQKNSGMEVDKPVELSEDNPVAKSNPFVFFSAKGSEIKVSEKTLSSIRRSRSDQITGTKSVRVDSSPLMKVFDLNKQSTNNAKEMPAASISHAVAVDKSSGNCSRSINATETVLPTITVCTSNVQCISVRGSTVSGPAVKSVRTVSDDADIDAKVVSTDADNTTCVSASVHASSDNATEQRLPLKAMNLYSACVSVGSKRHTDHDVRMPLYVVPESKCSFAVFL